MDSFYAGTNRMNQSDDQHVYMKAEAEHLRPAQPCQEGFSELVLTSSFP